MKNTFFRNFFNCLQCVYSKYYFDLKKNICFVGIQNGDKSNRVLNCFKYRSIMNIFAINYLFGHSYMFFITSLKKLSHCYMVSTDKSY